MNRRWTLIVAVSGLLSAGAQADPPAPDASAESRIVICYTSGSVSSRDARPAIEKMVRVLERLAGWGEGTWSGLFTDDPRECERLATSEKPKFLIPSLGFYLRHRKDDGLVPVAQPRIHGADREVLRILVRKGTAESLDALRGHTLGGTLLDDAEFLRKVVFKGRVDPASFFQLKPSRVALRPLRDLAAGKMDAVLVNDQQYRALGGLPFASDLAVVFESDPIPLPGVFAVESRTTTDERRRLSRALEVFCGHAEGRSFCELFGMEGFNPADASTYQPVQALWEGR